MKRNRIVGIGGLCVLIGMFFFARIDSGVQVQIKTIRENTESYEIYVEYPQFSDVKRSFNNRIRKEIEDSIESFKGEVSRFDDVERVIDEPYTYHGSWISDQLNDEYISFVYRSSFYTGGAHGGRDIRTFTYDVKAGKELELIDLFAGQSDYLERISRYVINDLKKQLSLREETEPNMEMIADGASPDIENFSRFTIHRDGFISFYFPEYQVAPYASGEQKVIIPASFIENRR